MNITNGMQHYEKPLRKVMSPYVWPRHISLSFFNYSISFVKRTRVCNKSNTTGGTRGEGTAYPS